MSALRKKYLINVDFPDTSRVHLNPLYYNSMWCQLDEDKIRRDGGKIEVTKEEAEAYLTGREPLMFNGRNVKVDKLEPCKNCSRRYRRRKNWDISLD